MSTFTWHLVAIEPGPDGEVAVCRCTWTSHGTDAEMHSEIAAHLNNSGDYVGQATAAVHHHQRGEIVIDLRSTSTRT